MIQKLKGILEWNANGTEKSVRKIHKTTSLKEIRQRGADLEMRGAYKTKIEENIALSVFQMNNVFPLGFKFYSSDTTNQLYRI